MSYFDLLVGVIIIIAIPFVTLMVWLFGDELCQK